MLTGKQKRFLRGRAHHLDAILQIGKGGVNENLIKQVRLALEARELIKVSILQNCEEDRHEVAERLAKGAEAELVQLVGKTVVLYRPSTKESGERRTANGERGRKTGERRTASGERGRKTD